MEPSVLYGNNNPIGTDLMLEIPRSRVDGYSAVNKFGSNVEVSSGTTEDVWDGGGAYSFPITADITHVSQVASQTAMRGQTVEVQGLDAEWNLVVQTVTLDASDSTTPVALATALIRVFRMKVLANVVIDQAISLKNIGGVTTYATMRAGKNQTLMAIYCVPAGYTAYMTNYYFDYVRDASRDPTGVEFALSAADRANGYEFQVKHQKGVPKQAPGHQHMFKPYYKFTEKTDIKISAQPSGADAHVHAGFDLILVRN